MSHGDPTDNALAAIASILDQPPVIPRERVRPPVQDAAANPPPLEPPPLEPPPLEPPPLDAPSVAEAPLSFESFAGPPPLETPPPLEPPPPVDVAVPPPLAVAAPSEAPPPIEVAVPIEANGYCKVGPGPMAAIRFKWTVREDGGDYYVDETIGDHSTPVVIGPLTGDGAIQLVNEREAEARRRFEQIKNEMAERAAATNLARKDSGEA